MQSFSGEEDDRPGLADMKVAAWRYTFELRLRTAAVQMKITSPPWLKHGPVTQSHFLWLSMIAECPKPGSNLGSALSTRRALQQPGSAPKQTYLSLSTSTQKAPFVDQIVVP
jgi:hypothetical protein